MWVPFMLVSFGKGATLYLGFFRYRGSSAHFCRFVGQSVPVPAIIPHGELVGHSAARVLAIVFSASRSLATAGTPSDCPSIDATIRLLVAASSAGVTAGTAVPGVSAT